MTNNRSHAAVSLLGALALLASSVTHARAAELFSGFGTPIVDGSITPGEWANASSVDIRINLPEGGSSPGKLFALNDGTSLYFALQFARQFVEIATSASIELDRDADQTFSHGDDYIIINPAIGFFDGFRTTNSPCPENSVCAFWDEQAGGHNDGAGAFGNDRLYTVFEFAHPFSSLDTFEDIQLKAGDAIGFSLFVRLINRTQMADTDLRNFGVLLISPEPIHYVDIDIRPGESPNNLNPKARGVVPVAIVSSRTFDATAEVDIQSLTFGHTGNERSLAQRRCKARDVNGDGLLDLVCSFEIPQAGLMRGDTAAVLKGRTRSHISFEGRDRIRTVPVK